MKHVTLPSKVHAQLAAVMDGAVRVGPLMGIPHLLQDLGQDPAAVFAEAGVPLDIMDDPEHSVSFGAAGRLLRLCAERTGCPHFGLLVGQGAGPDCLGLVGMLAHCSPDLSRGLRNIVLYLHLHDRGAIPTLKVVEDRVLLGYAIYQPGVEGTAQIHDLAMAIGNQILSAFCGTSWRPQAVHLSHARPADISPYRRAFGAPLRFDAEQSAIVFPAAWLAHPLPGADPDRYRELEGRIADLTGPVDRDLAVQVRRVTCNLLRSGQGSREAVAGVFSVHPRTLNRRLQEQGTSFRQVREECQHEAARQLLRDTDLPVADIAAILGYADSPAFIRAFRRWTGTAPAGWRAALRLA